MVILLNPQRARAAKVALDAYGKTKFGIKSPDEGNRRTVLVDLVTDLFHFAAGYELDIDELVKRAKMRFDSER